MLPLWRSKVPNDSPNRCIWGEIFSRKGPLRLQQQQRHLLSWLTWGSAIPGPAWHDSACWICWMFFHGSSVKKIQRTFWGKLGNRIFFSTCLRHFPRFFCVKTLGPEAETQGTQGGIFWAGGFIEITSSQYQLHDVMIYLKYI